MSNQPQAHVADERAAHKKPPGEMTLHEAAEIVVAGYYDGDFSDVLMRYEALATPAAVLDLLRAAIPAGANGAIRTWQERRDEDIKLNGEAQATTFAYAAYEIAELRARIAAGAPAETQCKWPTCLPESEQQALAAQVHGEMYSGAPAETPKPVIVRHHDILSSGHWLHIEDRDDIVMAGTRLYAAQPAPATATDTRTHRKAYICKSCEGVYADEPVTGCDCMPDKQEFIEGEIIYPMLSANSPREAG